MVENDFDCNRRTLSAKTFLNIAICEDGWRVLYSGLVQSQWQPAPLRSKPTEQCVKFAPIGSIVLLGSARMLVLTGIGGLLRCAGLPEGGRLSEEQLKSNTNGKPLSVLTRAAHLAIGSALTAGDLLEEGVSTALAVNRRVLDTVERVAEPLMAPLDAIGVTKAVRQQVETVTSTVNSVVGGLEDKGRAGLLAGDGAAPNVLGGVIDNVLAFLRQSPEVNQLIDVQLDRILPALGAHPAVQQLVRAQIVAILPELMHDPAVQALIRAQAGEYLAYLQTNPDQVQPLIRQQGDIYIDYLNDHPAPVQTLVQGQSLSLAGQLRDEVRERTVTGDSLVDSIVRSLLRLKPREELPPPPELVQRRAESGRLTSDFVKGRDNGAA